MPKLEEMEGLKQILELPVLVHLVLLGVAIYYLYGKQGMPTLDMVKAAPIHAHIIVGAIVFLIYYKTQVMGAQKSQASA